MALIRARPAPTEDPDSSRLIERDAAQAALRTHLDEAVSGRGRFVVVRGEAGIGKTALLRSFLASAAADGVAILAGACDGVSTPQPFGPLDDMVDGFAADGTLQLRALLDRSASRMEVGRWLLARLGDEPHVVAIEDVHWADQATLELLAYLARRLEDLPAIVVVTVREDVAAEPSVVRILGSIASQSVTRQVRLEPLTRAGVARLVGDRGTTVEVDELFRLSAGNPFYVHEVLESGAVAAASGGNGGNARAAGLSAREIPVSVVDAVRARVAQLDDRGRRALEAAGILGLRAEPWLLAAISGEDLTGIDDCLAVGLLIKADGIAFRHELTRMVVLEDLPAIRGIALHRRALDALERDGARAGAVDSARLAYHAEGAADAAAVLRHAPAAGDRAKAMGALHEAVAQYERALRFVGSADPIARADLLLSLASVLYMTNQIPASYEAGLAAIAHLRELGDRVRLASALATLATPTFSAGHPDEGWSFAREAALLTEDSGDTHEHAMALCAIGRLGIGAGQTDETRAASRAALAMARRIDDLEVITASLGSIGTFELMEGDDAGWAHLEESAEVGRWARLPELVDRALNNLSECAVGYGRLVLALRYLDEMELYSERSEIERCNADAGRSGIALGLGDWAEAERLARSATSAARLDPIDRAGALAVLVRLAMRRGDESWRPVHELIVEIDRRMASAQVRWPLAALDAERAWIHGEAPPPSVRLAYEEAIETGERAMIGDIGIWLWRSGAIGSIDERAHVGHVLEVAGQAADAAADWDEKEMPYHAALARAGSTDLADVRRAHAALVSLGATAVAARVALRLRELGATVPRGPRPTTRSNRAGLTEREAEIARLVAEGLSNAEIAERLVLSPRTVGHHVSAILAKLDVPRRGSIAAVIERVGGAAPTPP